MNRREILAGVGAVALAGCGQTDQASGVATRSAVGFRATIRSPAPA